MHSENNTPERTWFIGGPPRVGKSILAYTLAKKIEGHVVSTDSIRDAAKKACTDKDSDLFIGNRNEDVSEEDWLETHINNPKKVVEYRNKEARAIWPSVVAFCNSFSDDSAIHILEGMSLLPSLISEMKHPPQHVFYVGNTNTTHLDAMLEYGKKFPEQDWMTALGYSEKKIAGMASFVREMSLYFKNEAEKYHFPYFEIRDEDFEQSIAEIIESVTK